MTGSIYACDEAARDRGAQSAGLTRGWHLPGRGASSGGGLPDDKRVALAGDDSLLDEGIIFPDGWMLPRYGKMSWSDCGVILSAVATPFHRAERFCRTTAPFCWMEKCLRRET